MFRRTLVLGAVLNYFGQRRWTSSFLQDFEWVAAAVRLLVKIENTSNVPNHQKLRNPDHVSFTFPTYLASS